MIIKIPIMTSISKQEFDKYIAEAKQEVAREIFAEIERILPNDFPFLGTAVAVYLSDSELKKKYIGEQK